MQGQSIAFCGWFSHIYLIAWIAKSSAISGEERLQWEPSIPGTYEGKCLASVWIPPVAVEKREPYMCVLKQKMSEQAIGVLTSSSFPGYIGGKIKLTIMWCYPKYIQSKKKWRFVCCATPYEILRLPHWRIHWNRKTSVLIQDPSDCKGRSLQYA